MYECVAEGGRSPIKSGCRGYEKDTEGFGAASSVSWGSKYSAPSDWARQTASTFIVGINKGRETVQLAFLGDLSLPS